MKSALFSALPDIVFAERNPATIERELIRGYETAYQLQYGEERKLYPGDPVRLFLESVAFELIHQRQIIDHAGKMNLLAYAEGGHLDHLGALLDVPRLAAKPAVTTLKFTISAPQIWVSLIPAGTRVTPGGGDIVFATSGPAEIPPDETTVEADAHCLIDGTAGNGFLAGQVRKIVDTFPWLASVENLTASAGGTDIESDENYRERIQLAPEKLSVAGPVGAYVYWARTASQLVSDVGVHSPAPGVVHVYPLLADGELPAQEILDRVQSKLSADDVRPTSELVQVLSPEPLNYELNFTWYLDRKNITAANAIDKAVNDAAKSWISWQKAVLGRDINPSELVRRVMSAGAKRVEIQSPAFTVLNFNQVAVCESSEAAFGGIEDG